MVAASVAVEAGGCFQRVAHEAVTGACAHHGYFLGAGAAGRSIGHLGDVSLVTVGLSLHRWSGGKHTWAQMLVDCWDWVAWALFDGAMVMFVCIDH